MKTKAFAFLLFFYSLSAVAQKAIYIPNEWRQQRTDTLLYAETDTENRYTWSKSRSRETENVIVFWDKYYGSKAPDQLSKSDALYVDIDDLLAKCEDFYDLECRELGFVNPETSNISRYKVMVLLNHTTDWVCYGSGYDFQVPALWLSPSTCHPVGHSVAHEVGHSFHYMCYAEDSNHGSQTNIQTGFHGAVGNGSVTWEQTAQWQANQSYPELMFEQSIGVFRNSHNLAFTHEWHRYQSYWFFYYLCQLTGRLTAVADVWNYRVTAVQDFNQVLMRQQDWNAETLYRHYYDYAAHCATWDFDAAIPYREAYVGDFHYAAVQTGERQYQVAYASAPQSTGFNVIPLLIPQAGAEIQATLTALSPAARLAEGDPGLFLNANAQWEAAKRNTYYSTGSRAYKGFRLGYVALMDDGSRRYIHADSVYCQDTNNDTARISMTIPEGVERLWMIVSPAPRQYYQHRWDENALQNDDAWPYAVAFEGTDIDENRATVYAPVTLDGRTVSDVAFTYDIFLPQRADYTPVNVVVGGSAAALLGTALQLQPTDIAAHITAYTASGPKQGQVMFYPLNPKTQQTVARASTANGYGHWFNATGNVSDYGSGYVYSEFDPTSLTFSIGQYPGKAHAGQDYTIGQALVYNDGSQKATATFLFRIHITDGKSGFALAEKTNGIDETAATNHVSYNKGVYDLSGRYISTDSSQPASLKKGLYIVDGRKTVVQ